MNEIQRFNNGSSPIDNATLLVFRRLGENAELMDPSKFTREKIANRITVPQGTIQPAFHELTSKLPNRANLVDLIAPDGSVDLLHLVRLLDTLEDQGDLLVHRASICAVLRQDIDHLIRNCVKKSKDTIMELILGQEMHRAYMDYVSQLTKFVKEHKVENGSIIEEMILLLRNHCKKSMATISVLAFLIIDNDPGDSELLYLLGPWLTLIAGATRNVLTRSKKYRRKSNLLTQDPTAYGAALLEDDMYSEFAPLPTKNEDTIKYASAFRQRLDELGALDFPTVFEVVAAAMELLGIESRQNNAGLIAWVNSLIIEDENGQPVELRTLIQRSHPNLQLSQQDTSLLTAKTK